jgi:hypothetical protein
LFSSSYDPNDPVEAKKGLDYHYFTNIDVKMAKTTEVSVGSYQADFSVLSMLDITEIKTDLKFMFITGDDNPTTDQLITPTPASLTTKSAVTDAPITFFNDFTYEISNEERMSNQMTINANIQIPPEVTATREAPGPNLIKDSKFNNDIFIMFANIVEINNVSIGTSLENNRKYLKNFICIFN